MCVPRNLKQETLHIVGVQSQIIMTLNIEDKITSCLYAHLSPLDDPSCVFFKCNEAVMR